MIVAYMASAPTISHISIVSFSGTTIGQRVGTITGGSLKMTM